eukprot:1001656-Amphidinium_carterae.1
MDSLTVCSPPLSMLVASTPAGLQCNMSTIQSMGSILQSKGTWRNPGGAVENARRALRHNIV